jgi:hypothetical protein
MELHQIKKFLHTKNNKKNEFSESRANIQNRKKKSSPVIQ